MVWSSARVTVGGCNVGIIPRRPPLLMQPAEGEGVNR